MATPLEFGQPNPGEDVLAPVQKPPTAPKPTTPVPPLGGTPTVPTIGAGTQPVGGTVAGPNVGTTPIGGGAQTADPLAFSTTSIAPPTGPAVPTGPASGATSPATATAPHTATTTPAPAYQPAHSEEDVTPESRAAWKASQGTPGTYDESGNPLWATAQGGQMKEDYDRKFAVVNMTPEERKRRYDELTAKYSGQTTQTSDHSSSTRPDDAMYATNRHDYNEYRYLEQIVNNPDTTLPLYTSEKGIYQTPVTGDPYDANFNEDNGIVSLLNMGGGPVPRGGGADIGRVPGAPSSAPGPSTGGGPSPRDRPGGSGVPTNPSTAPTNPTNPTNPTGPTPPTGPAYSLNPTDPTDSLIGKTITPGPGLDRYAQAMSAIQNYRDSTRPEFQADSRDIAANSFGAGRGVSGMNRTRQGNLADARERDINSKSFNYLNDALSGSVDDSRFATNLAERQQGFQKGLSDTAFDQEREIAMLNEYLTSGAFNRASAQQSAGYSDSPSEIGLILSAIFGNQSSAAAKAAAQSFQNAGNSGGNKSGSGLPGGLSVDDYLSMYDLWKRTQGGGTTGSQGDGDDGQ